MKSRTIRLIVILAAVSIAGIALTQIFWMQKAFDLKEKQFNFNVHLALREVARQILAANNNPAPVGKPVTQHSSDYFTVMVNDTINLPLLETLLQHELARRNIDTHFEYGIFNCNNEQMVFGSSLSTENEIGQASAEIHTLPRLNKDNYYFAVYFPNRDTDLINQMGIWWFSTLVLLLVIGFFAYAIFVILKQKRLSEVQKDFINNMTHEFKTPISTIAISAEVLRKPGIIAAPERLLSYATIIHDEANRLQKQVERVLQIASADSDSLKLKMEPVDVHQAIHEAVQNISPALTAKNGQVNLQLEATQTIVLADQLHLSNILFNLLDNAIKYTNGNPEIVIKTLNKGKSVCIEISDKGIGLTTDQQKKIFEKFYRVHTGNVHDVKGFGLGLHYVQRMIKAHNGQVSVQSTLGKGSIFTLSLPLPKQ